MTYVPRDQQTHSSSGPSSPTNRTVLAVPEAATGRPVRTPLFLPQFSHKPYIKMNAPPQRMVGGSELAAELSPKDNRAWDMKSRMRWVWG